jgi:aryl-alcohol dehydrogenase-like predicted oxidoreductase
MIFNRLAIGTANWGKKYNGAKVSEDDQKRILDYCQCSGIDMIDTATAYEWDWTKVNSCFNIVIRVNNHDTIARVKEISDSKPYCLMPHISSFYRDMLRLSGENTTGVSLYDLNEYTGSIERSASIFQVPYSIYDRRWAEKFRWMKNSHDYIGREIHVRSVFLRGKLLEKFKPWECIAFCLMNPYVDRVIIGADSYEQFKENLQPLHRMNSTQLHDENILDPRRWK